MKKKQAQKEADTLKPCPFCGASAQRTQVFYNGAAIKHIKCTRCTADIHGKAGATVYPEGLWNMRTGEEAGQEGEML